MRTTTRRWTARVVVLALVGSIMAPALRTDRTLTYRDAIPFQAPQNHILRQALGNLRLPEWDPSAYAGVPHLASPPAQALYPPRVAVVVASAHPAQSTDYSACLHLLLLAGGAWVLGRELGLRRSARAVLALTLLLAGPTFSALDNQPSLAGVAWLPWGFAGGLWARRGSLWRAGGVGLVLAAPVYAGAVQEALWSAALAAGALCSGGSPPRLKGLRVGLSAAWSLALSAAILLPALALAPHTTRGALEAGEVGVFSFHPARILELVLPFPWGVPFPERGAYLGAAFEPRAGELWSHSAYLGIVPLLFALRAFSSGVCARLRRTRGLLAALGVGGLVLACGRHLPGFASLAATPYGVFRYPEKHLSLFVLAAAGLAALALHADRRRARSDAWLAGGTLVVVWGALAATCFAVPGLAEAAGKQAPGVPWAQALGVSALTVAWWVVLGVSRSSARRRWALCALGVLSALPVARRLVFVGPAGLVSERPPAAALLGQQVDRFGFPERFFVEPRPFGLPPAGLSDGVAVPAVQLLTLRGASPALYGLHGVQGMTGWWPRNAEALSATPELRSEAAVAWWVGPREQAASASGRYDLPHGVSVVRLAARPRLELLGTAGRIEEVRQPRPERLRVSVYAEAAGELLWRESAYPGWTVLVLQAGQRVSATSASAKGPFLSVPVPPGESTVEFRYRTPGLIVGGAVTGIALLALLGVSVVGGRRSFRRRSHSVDSARSGVSA